MHHDYDFAIVGGGPAGAACAIKAAQHGRRVLLLERSNGDYDAPGETLHPGIAPLLQQPGISEEELAEVTGARHAGVWVEWAGERRFQAYRPAAKEEEEDAAEEWLGYQVHRRTFDAMLRQRAQALGVTVQLNASVPSPLLEDGVVCGLSSDGEEIRAQVVVDATGRNRWLTRALEISSSEHSPPLHARYGYAQGSCPARADAPLMQANAKAWTWSARVRQDVYQWTHLSLDGTKLPSDWMPEELRHLQALGSMRGADVTWRIADETCGPGWFLIGDAAAILDPSSSHGVLKALMSGIMAAHLAEPVLLGKAPEQEAGMAYQTWLHGWFANDVAQLRQFYGELGTLGA